MSGDRRHEITRGFALTRPVVSLEVPRSYTDLMALRLLFTVLFYVSGGEDAPAVA